MWSPRWHAGGWHTQLCAMRYSALMWGQMNGSKSTFTPGVWTGESLWTYGVLTGFDVEFSVFASSRLRCSTPAFRLKHLRVRRSYVHSNNDPS